MDIKDVNIHNVGSLTEEDHAQIRRQAARNLMSFVALKVAIFASIALVSRHLRKKLDAMD